MKVVINIKTYYVRLRCGICGEVMRTKWHKSRTLLWIEKKIIIKTHKCKK